MRQQADRQVTGAAVESSDTHAVGDFSSVGPVSMNPILAPRALLDTCVTPSLMPNVAPAGVTALENDLHRHPKSARRGALHLSGLRWRGCAAWESFRRQFLALKYRLPDSAVEQSEAHEPVD
jgi:hypothetical protein